MIREELERKIHAVLHRDVRAYGDDLNRHLARLAGELADLAERHADEVLREENGYAGREAPAKAAGSPQGGPEPAGTGERPGATATTARKTPAPGKPPARSRPARKAAGS